MSLRARLAVLYTVIVGGILLLYGVAVYVAVSYSLTQQADTILIRAVNQIWPNIYVDSSDISTIYLDLRSLGGECFSTYSGIFLGEGEAETRWLTSLDTTRWDGSDETRWSVGDVVVDGIHC